MIFWGNLFVKNFQGFFRRKKLKKRYLLIILTLTHLCLIFFRNHLFHIRLVVLR